MPAGYMKYLNRDTYLEMHKTVPQPQLGGRGPIVPVAKTLGGGSAVNAMVYMRGQQEDFDGWAEHVGTLRPATGRGSSRTTNLGEWSYKDMLGHFKALEANERFNNRYHGTTGRLRVSEP